MHQIILPVVLFGMFALACSNDDENSTLPSFDLTGDWTEAEFDCRSSADDLARANVDNFVKRGQEGGTIGMIHGGGNKLVLTVPGLLDAATVRTYTISRNKISYSNSTSINGVKFDARLEGTVVNEDSISFTLVVNQITDSEQIVQIVQIVQMVHLHVLIKWNVSVKNIVLQI